MKLELDFYYESNECFTVHVYYTLTRYIYVRIKLIQENKKKLFALT